MGLSEQCEAFCWDHLCGACQDRVSADTRLLAKLARVVHLHLKMQGSLSHAGDHDRTADEKVNDYLAMVSEYRKQVRMLTPADLERIKELAHAAITNE